MARRFSREQVSQKWIRAPFSTEQVQVGRGSSLRAPQRAHTIGAGSASEPWSPSLPGGLVTHPTITPALAGRPDNARRGPLRS